MSKDNNYLVGNGKPPKHTQFKPGQSGNPRGRPPGSKNLATDLTEELGERLPVNIGGKKVKLSKQRTLVKTMLQKAMNGDTRSAGIIFRLMEKLLDTGGSEKESSLSPDDRAVLEDFEQQIRMEEQDKMSDNTPPDKAESGTTKRSRKSKKERRK